MTTLPTLVRTAFPSGEPRYSLCHRIVDLYLEFVAGRVRSNSLRAVAAFDLIFFNVLKDPLDIVAADIFEFLADQRSDWSVIRLSDVDSGRSPRTTAFVTGRRWSHRTSCFTPRLP